MPLKSEDLEISNWKEFKKNTLLGFFDLRILPIDLCIRGCTYHEKEGKRWVGFPARPYKDKAGKETWANIVEFPDKQVHWAVQDILKNAVERHLAPL